MNLGLRHPGASPRQRADVEEDKKMYRGAYFREMRDQRSELVVRRVAVPVATDHAHSRRLGVRQELRSSQSTRGTQAATM